MLFLIKKIVFKFMELGLGLKPFFLLATRNPIFLNFKLTGNEADQVRKSLPPGFKLDAIRFSKADTEPSFCISYNLYELQYPKKELAHLHKRRCEINTFVTDPNGRRGIYVFSGSPFVSKELHWNAMGFIADLAERFVMWIYGEGKLIPMDFELSPNRLRIHLGGKINSISADVHLPVPSGETMSLSEDYLLYNDVSFFNHGKTYDLVNSNSGFSLARFCLLKPDTIGTIRIKGPFFDRSPDALYIHFGEISYLVSALNKNPFQRTCESQPF